jgi:cellulose synthase/poly-beta-1,6-N-acetylglucosamine synthase-like glycosyltransferase
VTSAVIALALVSLCVGMIDLAFILEIVSGLAPLKASEDPGPLDPGTHYAVLMPAHNEAATILRAAPYLAAIEHPGRRILVVADNCTDDTANLARATGVAVVERHDVGARGKGYALAFGRESLRGDPPAAVIVLDADCQMSPEALDKLAARSLKEEGPVQAAYLFRPALTAAPTVQLSNFAFMVKNLFRQRGLARLGASAILTGSGMAFPWSIFDQLSLSTGDIVEDLAMTADLAEKQVFVAFEDSVQVWSDCSSQAGTVTQRARWEGGFLATALRRSPRLLRHGLCRQSWPMFWLGIHLLIPPLTLLLLFNFTMIAFSAILGCAGGYSFLLHIGIALTGIVFVIAFALGATWYQEGFRHMRLATLLRLPAYIGWKVVIYARLLFQRRRAGWIRTERMD